MTIEIGYFFNDICGSTSNSWFGKIFNNVIYTSILMAVIILIIIFFTYPTKKGTPLYAIFRVIFYVFVAVLLLQAIQQRIIETKYEDKYSSKINKEILTAVRGGNSELFGSDKTVKITPKYVAPKQNSDGNDDYGGSTQNTEMTDEKILEYVLGAADKYKNKPVNVEDETDEEESDQEIASPIKVSGASVDDMLRDLGV